MVYDGKLEIQIDDVDTCRAKKEENRCPPLHVIVICHHLMWTTSIELRELTCQSVRICPSDHQSR
ncbi:hypothetical protein T11_16363 [Trichinella zimbabwensis]|uniref:Uncharacterized protein n=1 Tax=Trichinella zimbabwensis TaxID=268475 RepID=A0A0V1HBR7_9BILA|nr:hypothetical protein T11_16363 [Trichinella zimbabwensis]